MLEASALVSINIWIPFHFPKVPWGTVLDRLSCRAGTGPLNHGSRSSHRKKPHKRNKRRPLQTRAPQPGNPTPTMSEDINVFFLFFKHLTQKQRFFVQNRLGRSLFPTAVCGPLCAESKIKTSRKDACVWDHRGIIYSPFNSFTIRVLYLQKMQAEKKVSITNDLQYEDFFPSYFIIFIREHIYIPPTEF